MEGKEQSKTGEPLSLSQILLSTNNPFASSTKVKNSLEQSKKRPVGPTSMYEFVRIGPDNPEKHKRHKKTKRVADVESTDKKVPSFAKKEKEIVMSSPQFCSPAMEKAKEVEASLSREHPSFIKAMTPSDVTHAYFMRFPREFINSHFPTNEERIIVLEDEKGKQYKTKYLPQYASLSAGWRRFAFVKSLRENDVLVFHLVQPGNFKVYILRPDDFDPVDNDLSLREPKEITLKKKRSRPNDVETNTSQEKDENLKKKKRSSKKPKAHPNVVETNTSQENVENHNPSADIMSSEAFSSFRKFKIIVDNKNIDPEIPKQIRNSYFVLCGARNSYLHRHVIKGIGIKLAASIISETTNIAHAITNSDISTPREYIAYWNTVLQSFEFIGMDVGFIRTRLDRLLSLVRECSKAITDSNKNINIYVQSGVARIEEEIREHESKIEELKILKEKVEMRKNINESSMDEIVEKFKVMYKEEAKAPW